MSDNGQAAQAIFGEGYNCAQSVLAACGPQFGLSRETAIRVAQAFGGGMCTGATCGAVTGAFMTIGLKHSKKDPQDNHSRNKAHELVLEFSARFKARNGSLVCNDLLGVDYGTDEGKRLARERGLFKTVCAKAVRDAAEIVTQLLSEDAATTAAKDTHELVKNAYAEVARKQDGCCRPKASCCDKKPYTVPDHPVPESELGLSCGNPLAFGHISTGNVVLDLGSGAGKDVFLAAQKVGESGRVIGVDMTPEMLALARKNAVKFFTTTGLANVEFREGHIEKLPVETASVDVVISNCVINLSTDKAQVFREVHRVLKDGGRMIVSDIVLNRPLSEEFKKDPDLYAGCIAGALLRQEYLQAIRDAGFTKVQVLSDNTYQAAQAGGDPITSGATDALSGAAASVTILAEK